MSVSMGKIGQIQEMFRKWREDLAELCGMIKFSNLGNGVDNTGLHGDRG